MYFVALPCEIYHSHKLIGSVRLLDKEVRREIFKFVSHGVMNVEIVKSSLRKFVTEIFTRSSETTTE